MTNFLYPLHPIYDECDIVLTFTTSDGVRYAMPAGVGGREINGLSAYLKDSDLTHDVSGAFVVTRSMVDAAVLRAYYAKMHRPVQP